MDAILYFRSPVQVMFRDQLFNATDDDRGDIYAFPKSEVLDVPPQFVSVKSMRPGFPATKDNWVPDDETEAFRRLYWDYILPTLGVRVTDADFAATLANQERVKQNFIMYGTPDEPVAPSAPEGKTK